MMSIVVKLILFEGYWFQYYIELYRFSVLHWSIDGDRLSKKVLMFQEFKWKFSRDG